MRGDPCAAGCGRHTGRDHHEYCVVCWDQMEHGTFVTAKGRRNRKRVDEMLAVWEDRWGKLPAGLRSQFHEQDRAQVLAFCEDQNLVHQLIRQHKRLEDVWAAYRKAQNLGGGH